VESAENRIFTNAQLIAHTGKVAVTLVFEAHYDNLNEF
jgi:hypothetical protein